MGYSRLEERKGKREKGKLKERIRQRNSVGDPGGSGLVAGSEIFIIKSYLHNQMFAKNSCGQPFFFFHQ
jgi:hypothetical protein